ncbi:hypothetical protein CEXT_719261 [Caerostris extrusa]|uniref:Uncharacterized protein n=1 Tax=Caerostris extrusa TaxID=172846 RepID=A0AAV4T6M4_CAEEX|nr:hypothetical protein CEXT_719261 [Caerostris extrusa]
MATAGPLLPWRLPMKRHQGATSRGTHQRWSRDADRDRLTNCGKHAAPAFCTRDSVVNSRVIELLLSWKVDAQISKTTWKTVHCILPSMSAWAMAQFHLVRATHSMRICPVRHVHAVAISRMVRELLT